MTSARAIWDSIAAKASKQLQEGWGLKPGDADYQARMDQFSESFKKDVQATNTALSTGIKPAQADPASQGQALSGQLQDNSDRNLNRMIRGSQAGTEIRGTTLDQDTTHFGRRAGIVSDAAASTVQRGVNLVHPILQQQIDHEANQGRQVTQLAQSSIDQFYGDRDKNRADIMKLSTQSPGVLELIQSIAPIALQAAALFS